MEREAYEAWEKSKNQKETKSKKQSDAATSTIKKTEVSIKTESNFGDDKYLKLVQWCIDKRCKLLGLDAPQKHELSGSIETENTDKLRTVVDKMSDEERKLFFGMIEHNDSVMD